MAVKEGRSALVRRLAREAAYAINAGGVGVKAMNGVMPDGRAERVLAARDLAPP